LSYRFKCKLCGRVYVSLEGAFTCVERHGTMPEVRSAFVARVPLRRVRRVNLKGLRRLEDFGGGRRG
jgi:rubredoxin